MISDVVIIGLLATNAAFVGVGVYILYRFHVFTQLRVGSIASFLSSRGDEPSDLAHLWDSMVERALGKMGGQIMGQRSGVVRADMAAAKDMVRQSVQTEYPILAMVADKLWKNWDKHLAKNPGMIDSLQPLIEKYMGGEASQKDNGAIQSKFRMGGE